MRTPENFLHGGVAEMLRRVDFGDFAVEVKQTELGQITLSYLTMFRSRKAFCVKWMK
jgi:hypothetical protein